MAKKPVSPAVNFENVTTSSSLPVIAFPASFAKELDAAMSRNGTALAAQLNKLMERVGADAPIGKRITDNLFYLSGNKNNSKDNPGLVVLHAPRKDMPVMVLGTMTYGDFVKAQTRPGARSNDVMRTLTETANELVAMYPDKSQTAKPADKTTKGVKEVKVPAGFKAYTQFGIAN